LFLFQRILEISCKWGKVREKGGKKGRERKKGKKGFSYGRPKMESVQRRERWGEEEKKEGGERTKVAQKDVSSFPPIFDQGMGKGGVKRKKKRRKGGRDSSGPGQCIFPIRSVSG